MTGEEEITKPARPRAKPRLLPPPEDYLTLEEAGAVLRVRARQMTYLVARKRIRSAKIEGRRLIRRVDLDAYVAAGMNDTKAEVVA